MAATLGDTPTARALRGTSSSQPCLPHLAKHFFLGFLFPFWAKEPNTNKMFPPRHLLLVTMLIFAFTGLRYRINVWELLKPAPVGNLWRLSGVWRRYFGTTELISMHGMTLRLQGSQCVINLQELDFLFVKFDSPTMESCTSAAVSYVQIFAFGPYRSELARSGRREVAVRRRQKPITANTKPEQPKRYVWNPFRCGKQRKTKPKRRCCFPPTTAVRVTVQAALLPQCCVPLFWVLHCSPSVIDPQKIEKSCSDSFSALIFQVLRTQR